MIRVVIVDDHALVRAGLAELLEAEDDIEVVGTAANGEEMNQLLETQGADLVILDVRLPGEDGFNLARAIRSRSLSCACSSCCSQCSSSTYGLPRILQNTVAASIAR